MRLVEVLQVAGTILGALASAFAVIEKRLLARFRRASATSAETAMAVPRLGAFSRWRLVRLRSTRAVLPVEVGRLYLDEAAYAAGRKKRALLGVTLVIVALAVVVIVHTALR